MHPATKLFEYAMSKVTDAEVDNFLAYRRQLMTYGPGNICVSRSPKWNTPFIGCSYEHLRLLPDFTESPWPALLNSNPRDLIEPDPTAPSKYRPFGYACWDAAIAIPDTEYSYPMLAADMRSVPALRKCNTFWPQYQTMLNRVGRLSPGGPVLRYSSPMTFDLTQTGDIGWRMLEAAHVLAHKRVDSKSDKINLSLYNSNMYNKMATILAEMVVGYLFDIPVDVSGQQLGLFGYPDMEYYGISVRMTPDVFNPRLRMAIGVREAPRPDKSLIHILASVHIEPTPYNYAGKDIRTPNYHWHDRFACKPSIVTILGWESVDVITHAQRINSNRYGPNYVMPAYDLMPPNTLWLYLKLCERRWGKPPIGDYYGLPNDRGRGEITSRLAYVNDWIQLDNPEYKRLYDRTLPFPCPYCYTVNYNDKNAKRRPYGKVPIHPKKAGEWDEYLKSRNQILKLTTKPIIEYEATLYGGMPKVRKMRALRKLRYKLLDDCLRYDKLIERSTTNRYSMSANVIDIVEGRKWVDRRPIVTDKDGRKMVAAHPGRKDSMYLGEDGKPIIE